MTYLYNLATSRSLKQFEIDNFNINNISRKVFSEDKTYNQDLL